MLLSVKRIKKRVQAYNQRSVFINDKDNAHDLLEFYETLDIKLYLQPLSKQNINRIVQLFAKTNQFNLTGKRYSHDNLTKTSKRKWPCCWDCYRRQIFRL